MDELKPDWTISKGRRLMKRNTIVFLAVLAVLIMPFAAVSINEILKSPFYVDTDATLFDENDLIIPTAITIFNDQASAVDLTFSDGISASGTSGVADTTTTYTIEDETPESNRFIGRTLTSNSNTAVITAQVGNSLTLDTAQTRNTTWAINEKTYLKVRVAADDTEHLHFPLQKGWRGLKVEGIDANDCQVIIQVHENSFIDGNYVGN